MIAYDEHLPLIRETLATKPDILQQLKASLIVPDIRIIERLVRDKYGWSVIPEYLCSESLKQGKVIAIDRKKTVSENSFYLVWHKSLSQQTGTSFMIKHILQVKKSGRFELDN